MDRWVSPLWGDELSHVGATRLHSGICGHTYSIQKAALLLEHVTKHEYHTGHGDGTLCHTWYICMRYKKEISRQSQRWNILLLLTHAVIIIWSFEIWCIILHKLHTINPKWYLFLTVCLFTSFLSQQINRHQWYVAGTCIDTTSFQASFLCLHW